MDKRRVFYKTLEKLGAVEEFSAWSQDDKDWADRAELAAQDALRKREKEISEAALGELVNRAGANARQLENEIEKLCVYTGDRNKIELADVTAICCAQQDGQGLCPGRRAGRPRPAAPAQAAGRGAVGDQIRQGQVGNRPALWLDRQSPRHAAVEGNAARGLGESGRGLQPVQGSTGAVPADKLPADKKFNPLALNPYVLYKALPQVKKYTSAELVRAMDVLLRCNQRLVSSGLDEALVLQQALVQIVTPSAAA